MKKLFMLCSITIFISILIGLFIFINYKKNLDESINYEENLYMILYGSYNSIDKVNKLDVGNYILRNESGFYKVYIGVTKTYEDACKVKSLYLLNNIDTYILEKEFNNKEFIEYVSNITLEDKDSKEIINIENDVINKYKEVFNE